MDPWPDPCRPIAPGMDQPHVSRADVEQSGRCRSSISVNVFVLTVVTPGIVEASDQ